MALSRIVSMKRGVYPLLIPINCAASHIFLGWGSSPFRSPLHPSRGGIHFRWKGIDPPFISLFYFWRCRALLHCKEIISRFCASLLLVALSRPPSFKKTFIALSRPTLVTELSRTLSQNTVFIALLRGILLIEFWGTVRRLFRFQVQSHWNRR